MLPKVGDYVDRRVELNPGSPGDRAMEFVNALNL